MLTNPEFSTDLLTFTNEILNGKLYFLSSTNVSFPHFFFFLPTRDKNQNKVSITIGGLIPLKFKFVSAEFVFKDHEKHFRRSVRKFRGI